MREVARGSADTSQTGTHGHHFTVSGKGLFFPPKRVISLLTDDRFQIFVMYSPQMRIIKNLDQ